MVLPPHSHIIDFTVHLCLETTDGHIPRCIDPSLMYGRGGPPETLAVELRGMAVMVDAVRDTRRDYRTCGEGGKDFVPSPRCASGRVFMTTSLKILEKSFIR